MFLTGTELQLASLAVAALAIRATAKNSRRSERFQRWKDATARLEERRGAVYQEILIDMDRSMRSQRRFGVERHTGESEWPVDEIADDEAARKARVDLFASKTVPSKWNAWLDVFSEGWGLADAFRAAGGTGTGELAERSVQWERALSDTYDAVVAQMREECGHISESTEHLPAGSRLTARIGIRRSSGRSPRM